MRQLFPAVLISTWKRKEVTIFLLFALYPLVYFVASYFGKSNFMQIIPNTGDKLGFITFLFLMMGTVNSLILPTLALYFLTISVFKKEIENHTLFLYKDLDRSQIFRAKFLSLVAVVSVYYFIFSVVTALVHYTRVIHQPFGTPDLFDGTSIQVLSTIFGILTFYLQDLISIALATVVCLYWRSGTTLVFAVMMTITMLLTPLLGGPIGMLFPGGYIALSESGVVGLAQSLLGALGVTLLYSMIFLKIGLSRFKKLEF